MTVSGQVCEIHPFTFILAGDFCDQQPQSVKEEMTADVKQEIRLNFFGEGLE